MREEGRGGNRDAGSANGIIAGNYDTVLFVKTLGVRRW